MSLRLRVLRLAFRGLSALTIPFVLWVALVTAGASVGGEAARVAWPWESPRWAPACGDACTFLLGAEHLAVAILLAAAALGAASGLLRRSRARLHRAACLLVAAPALHVTTAALVILASGNHAGDWALYGDRVWDATWIFALLAGAAWLAARTYGPDARRASPLRLRERVDASRDDLRHLAEER